MRRKEKEIIDLNEIELILKRNYTCRIALSNNDFPYIIPMNYSYKKKALYFHSAKEGTKIDLIKNNPNACFEITEDIKIEESEQACSYGTKYRSVIGTGKIKIINNEKEKIECLNIIMEQHTKKNNWKYEEESLNKIIILKLKINEITGKQSGY